MSPGGLQGGGCGDECGGAGARVGRHPRPLDKVPPSLITPPVPEHPGASPDPAALVGGCLLCLCSLGRKNPCAAKARSCTAAANQARTNQQRLRAAHSQDGSHERETSFWRNTGQECNFSSATVSLHWAVCTPCTFTSGWTVRNPALNVSQMPYVPLSWRGAGVW